MPPSNTNTSIAVIQKDIEYIKESIQEQKKIDSSEHERQNKQISEIKAMLEKFTDTAHNTFATKEDHETNSKRIAELEEDKKAVFKYITIGFISIILTLAWVTKYMW